MALFTMFALLFVFPLNVGGTEFGGNIKGTLIFDENLGENLTLNITLEWILVNGKNLTSQDIRDLYGSDNWDGVKKAIEKTSAGIFNRTLEAMCSHPLSERSEIIIPESSPIYVEINGRGELNFTGDGKILSLLKSSSFSMLLNLSAINGAEIEITVPEGWSVNGERSYIWKGDEESMKIEHTCSVKNRASAFLDIYRIDTSGVSQKLFMNISINATIYQIPYPYSINSSSAEMEFNTVSVEMINYLMEKGMLDKRDVEERVDERVREIEERIVREFPGAGNISESQKILKKSAVILINASVTAPVENFESAAFLRWYSSQKIYLRLAGMEGFTINYTVIVPEGMKVMGIEHSGVPVFYRNYQGREGFMATISSPGDHRIGVSVGFVIDLSPLIPLFIALGISFVLWILVRKYIPERRRKHG